jgi:penicillin-binding protein 1C
VLFEAFARIKPEPAPLPPPPPATLIAGIAELPLPLQRFRSRAASFDPEAGAPELVFPPEGARLAAGTETVMVRIRGGEVPFLLLADGVPVMTRQYQREFDIPATGPGFSSLVIVDGKGRSDRVQIELQ